MPAAPPDLTPEQTKRFLRLQPLFPNLLPLDILGEGLEHFENGGGGPGSFAADNVPLPPIESLPAIDKLDRDVILGQEELERGAVAHGSGAEAIERIFEKAQARHERGEIPYQEQRLARLREARPEVTMETIMSQGLHNFEVFSNCHPYKPNGEPMFPILSSKEYARAIARAQEREARGECPAGEREQDLRRAHRMVATTHRLHARRPAVGQ